MNKDANHILRKIKRSAKDISSGVLKTRPVICTEEGPGHTTYKLGPDPYADNSLNREKGKTMDKKFKKARVEVVVITEFEDGSEERQLLVDTDIEQMSENRDVEMNPDTGKLEGREKKGSLTGKDGTINYSIWNI